MMLWLLLRSTRVPWHRTSRAVVAKSALLTVNTPVLSPMGACRSLRLPCWHHPQLLQSVDVIAHGSKHCMLRSVHRRTIIVMREAWENAVGTRTTRSIVAEGALVTEVALALCPMLAWWPAAGHRHTCPRQGGRERCGCNG